MMKNYVKLVAMTPLAGQVNPLKNLGTLLNTIVQKNQESYEFMLWLIGFTDEEGTFSVEINKKDDMKSGFQVQI